MSGRVDRTMWERLFALPPDMQVPLQVRIRQTVVSAVLDGRLSPGTAVPSSRELAETLGIARNTVVLAYQQLVDSGFLVSRERSGYFVSGDVRHPPAALARPGFPAEPGGADWSRRFVARPSRQRNIVKSRDWQRYPYPFLYGQLDPTLFPAAEWRECSRRALGASELRDWAPDLIDGDDPLLVEQIRSRLLPRRGVWVTPAEVMVTLGAQQALFLLAELLVGPGTTVAVEDPGYPDARNIFGLRTPRIRPVSVDGHGAVPGASLVGCDYLFVTPSHQCPTSATMPLARREELLALAATHDFVIVEDDYETRSSLAGTPTPALKSLDRAGRVLYVGSLSKVLAPGLRLGFLVGPPELIREARALRRLMVRHPPANNQRTAAHFLALGHHEALGRRLAHIHRDRAQVLRRALDRLLPEISYSAAEGGSSFWLEGPPWLDARDLAERAADRGVLIEPGDVFFAGPCPPGNFVRLGFSSISSDRIEAGVGVLAGLLGEMAPAGTRRAAAAG
ncbi:MAG TPA: PLP-dependent aminotransferase family protein [Beijerinckiaceae bacterium]|jgi:GntR family transcriptional regulator/MocR family aminotransferase